jgi:hypothetical protein
MFTVHREVLLVKVYIFTCTIRFLTTIWLSQRRHVTQNPVVRPGADNGHQDALQRREESHQYYLLMPFA